jgi:hypothetical protein
MSRGAQIIRALKCPECGLEDNSLNANIVDGHAWVVVLAPGEKPKVICFLCNERRVSKEV